MKRVALCMALAALAWGVGRAEGAAPPKSYLGRKEKKLSRADAVKLALKAVARESEPKRQQRLLNVTIAYWNLYSAQWTLRTREEGLRLAFESRKVMQQKYEAGRATKADMYQSKGQYELFRAQRLNALDAVIDHEGQLRERLGLAVLDGTRLVPSDSPTQAKYEADFVSARAEAMGSHPALQESRAHLWACQAACLTERVGRAVQGMPAGNSQETLERLAAASDQLKDQERKLEGYLSMCYRRLSLNYEQIRANRAQREAFGEQLQTRQQEFQAGRGTLDILLEAQRFYTEALSQEHQAIASYNNALAGFHYARGEAR